MKTKLSIILLSTLCFSILELYSQEPCKVLKQEIADKYEGKCKKGLANGKGIATGKDKYEGDFKNGLPQGKGKYTWANGEVYEGRWKDGVRNGEGKFYYKKNGVDSVKIGIWENDVFVRKIIPNPYRILRTFNVGRYSVVRTMEGNKVMFSLMQNGSPNSSAYNVTFSPSSGTEFEMGTKKGYENVVFPFSCKVTFITPNSFRTSSLDVQFEIEITEPGVWEVVINN